MNKIRRGGIRFGGSPVDPNWAIRVEFIRLRMKDAQLIKSLVAVINVRRTRLCQTKMISRNSTPFERSSKRRRGYPSETRVKRGFRVVHSEKELIEKLGRNDLCPKDCGLFDDSRTVALGQTPERKTC